MTPRQIELARHALGLRATRLQSYRNHFTAELGHADFADWQAMVAAGFATERTSKFLPPGVALFHLTRAGAERALLPGDVLDAEDWPALPVVEAVRDHKDPSIPENPTDTGRRPNCAAEMVEAWEAQRDARDSSN